MVKGGKTKIASPCVSVCKFKREGHCIACSMTKAQKKIFKKLKRREERAAFIELLEYQQAQLGRYDAWPILYAKKLAKKAKAAKGKPEKVKKAA
ncbi:MAG: DUF1289 domain-containing protein [Pseudomonadota bacterium]